jgi:hypothetical protein
VTTFVSLVGEYSSDEYKTGPCRARSHCRFCTTARPLHTRSTKIIGTFFLKRQCDRTLGPRSFIAGRRVYFTLHNYFTLYISLVILCTKYTGWCQNDLIVHAGRRGQSYPALVAARSGAGSPGRAARGHSTPPSPFRSDLHSGTGIAQWHRLARGDARCRSTPPLAATDRHSLGIYTVILPAVCCRNDSATPGDARRGPPLCSLPGGRLRGAGPSSPGGAGARQGSSRTSDAVYMVINRRP